MRKLAKGGADTVFICKHGRTSDDLCIKDFTDDFNFIFDDVPDDGNCFFHTLELYYKKKGNTDKSKNYNNLRGTIISHILENWSYFSDFGISEDDIFELASDGSWNNDAGDIVIPAAASALNLKIILYDLKRGQRSPPIKKQIIRHIYPETGPIPDETVNILRLADSHFGLLTPNPKNNTESITKRIENLSISSKIKTTKPQRKTQRKKKSTSVSPSSSVSSRRRSTRTKGKSLL